MTLIHNDPIDGIPFKISKDSDGNVTISTQRQRDEYTQASYDGSPAISVPLYSGEPLTLESCERDDLVKQLIESHFTEETANRVAVIAFP